MPKISIIVPVYNVEKYLQKCVDSILAQSFRDYELILVDDGATDASPSICDDYAEKDQRVKVIHKQNGGLSDARTAGINVASAPFLGFIDSDDYIAPDMYEQLYFDMIDGQADLAICGIYDIYENKDPKQLPEVRKVLTPEQTLKMILDAKLISVHAVNKLYRREIFSKIRYPVNVITEDAAVIIPILQACKKVVINTKQQYYYVHHVGTISSRSFSDRDLDTINVWERNEEIVKRTFPALAYACHTRVCWANFLVLDKIMVSKNWRTIAVRKKIILFLKKNWRFIIKNNRLTKGRKLAFLALVINEVLYRQIILQTKTTLGD